MADAWVVYWLFDETCVCPRWSGYVGISAQWPKRLGAHRRSGRWPAGFSSCVLSTGSKLECRWMEWNLRPASDIGWNLSVGGKPNVRLTADSRQRMSAASKNKVFSSEAREKIRVASTGRTNKGRKGQKKSSEEIAKIVAGHLGRKASDETRAKLSASHMGNKSHLGFFHSEVTKKTISDKKRGVPIHSEEEKRKRAERWKGNALTKGKPWSAARRLAWLQHKEM